MPARVVNAFDGNINLQTGETSSPVVAIDDDITRVTVTISRQGMSGLSKIPDIMILYMEVSLDGGVTWPQRKRIGIEGSDLNYQFGIAPFSFTGMKLIRGENRVGRVRLDVKERFKFKVDLDFLVE